MHCHLVIVTLLKISAVNRVGCLGKEVIFCPHFDSYCPISVKLRVRDLSRKALFSFVKISPIKAILFLRALITLHLQLDGVLSKYQFLIVIMILWLLSQCLLHHAF